MKLLLFFSLLILSPVSSAEEHRRVKRAGSGPPPRNLLQATLDSFSNAVNTGNRGLLSRVCETRNHDLNNVFTHYQGSRFVVKAANYKNPQLIEGIVQAIISNVHGKSVTSREVEMRPSNESPTHWKVSLGHDDLRI